MSNSHLLASNLFSVKGLVAVVTGGGSGIGLMTTQALVANGAKVYIVGRREEALNKVVELYNPKVGSGAGQIIALPGDVTNKKDLERLVSEVEKKEKGIHIFVANAGISGPKTEFEGDESAQELKDGHFKGESFEDWQQVFNTNVTSVYFSILAFLPLLEKFTNGKDSAGQQIYSKYQTGVIITSSISGLVKSAQNHFAYNSSKAATIHLHKLLAGEFNHLGVRFNSIAPGVFPSEMTAGSESNDQQKVDISKSFDPASLKIPANRHGEEEEMAATVLYLCGRGGQYTNGVVIPLDGGTLLNNPSVA